jgi:site-specific recombinase XerD
MTNLLFSDRRMRPGLLGAHVHAFARLLLEQGYSKNTIKHKISVVADLDRWLRREHHRLSDLNEKRAEAFLHFRGSYALIKRGDSRTLELFLNQLRPSGVLSPPSPKLRESAMGRILRDYTDYMRQERGLSKLTIAGYESRVRSFFMSASAAEPSGPAPCARRIPTDTSNEKASRFVQRRFMV